MKANQLFTLALAGLLSAGTLVSCKDAGRDGVRSENERLQDADQNTDTAITRQGVRDHTHVDTEWEEFRTTSEQKLKENESRLDNFREKMEKSDEKLRNKYNKTVTTLEERNKEMRKKLDEYKKEGGMKWEEFKEEFNRDMDELGKAIQDLFKDNK